MKYFRTDLRGFFLTNGFREPQVIEYAALQTVKSYMRTFSAYLAVAKEWMYFFFILEWRYHSKAKLSGTTVTTMYLVSNVFFILPFLLSILFRCHGFSAELFICDCEFVLFVQLVKYCKYKEPNLSQNKIHVLERLVVLFYLVDIHTVTGFTTACRGLSPNL